MLAAILLLFLVLTVLPVLFVLSFGRGGPLVWIVAPIVCLWLIECAIGSTSGRKRRRDPNRCDGCGHRLLLMQQLCPECGQERLASRPAIDAPGGGRAPIAAARLDRMRAATPDRVRDGFR